MQVEAGPGGGQQGGGQEGRFRFGEQGKEGGVERQIWRQAFHGSQQGGGVPVPVVTAAAQHCFEGGSGFAAPQPACPQRRKCPEGLVGARQGSDNGLGLEDREGRRQVAQGAFEDVQFSFHPRRDLGLAPAAGPFCYLNGGFRSPPFDGAFERQPDILFQEARRDGKLFGARSFGGVRPEGVGFVEGSQDERQQGAAAGWGEA